MRRVERIVRWQTGRRRLRLRLRRKIRNGLELLSRDLRCHLLDGRNSHDSRIADDRCRNGLDLAQPGFRESTCLGSRGDRHALRDVRKSVCGRVESGDGLFDDCNCGNCFNDRFTRRNDRCRRLRELLIHGGLRESRLLLFLSEDRCGLFPSAKLALMGLFALERCESLI